MFKILNTGQILSLYYLDESEILQLKQLKEY